MKNKTIPKKLVKTTERLHPMGTPVHQVIGPSKRAEETVDIARLMVTQIANKYIQCDNKWEGMDKQRDFYEEAKRILEKYENYCEVMALLETPIKIQA